MEPNGGSTPRHPMAFPHCVERSLSSASRRASLLHRQLRALPPQGSILQLQEGQRRCCRRGGHDATDVAAMSPCRWSQEPGFAGRGANCDQWTRRRRSTGESEDVGRRSGVAGKKTLTTRNKEEAAHRARVLTSRLLQWRFANARLGKVMVRATSAAQSKLFYAWLRVAELRNIHAAKQIVAQRWRQKIKLGRLLRTQLSLLGTWDPVGESHSGAVADLGLVLSAASASVALTDGAEVHAGLELLHETMFACVRTVDEIAASADMFYATGGVMSSSAGELARTMRQEISGLQEVMRLCRIVASLQVQEVSLRANLIQVKQQIDQCLTWPGSVRGAMIAREACHHGGITHHEQEMAPASRPQTSSFMSACRK